MADIYRLSVTSEDRKACADMVRNLVDVFMKQNFIQSSIKQITEEWKSIARRIKLGEKMIEDILETKDTKLKNSQHFKELSDLYALLVTVCSFYDRFFSSAFQSQDEARWNKVRIIQNDVRQIFNL
jgi:hypothetical protein